MLVEALFPSGSVTGAPKRSSMEIISRVESAPRGIYTGAIGFFSRQRAHFNVAIRTVAIDRHTRTATFGVGSGIVWDSIEGDEYDECLVKASILTERRPAFHLLESIAWSPEKGFALLDGHLNRLHASAVYFRFAPVVRERIEEALSRAVGGCTLPQKVRLLLSRDGGVECVAGSLAVRPNPLRAALASHPVVKDDAFLYHKTSMRDVYEAAQRERPDVDAVILWNSDGEVTEATDANVVVEVDGRLVTPPVACGLLPGVKRAQLLASGEVVEQRVRVNALRQAGRFWLINSVRGWMPAEIDHSSSRSL
jgi:para-aminobenzoate synthetase / 4-amino-4-deoxychorismate lyase